jgi:ArsR family transcriptional regulator
VSATALSTPSQTGSLDDHPRSPLSGEPVSRSDAERLAGVLKALADPTRLRLLSLVQSQPRAEARVSELTSPLGVSQPTVSHHLRVLSEAGLLRREQRGVAAYYRLIPHALTRLADLLTPPDPPPPVP